MAIIEVGGLIRQLNIMKEAAIKETLSELNKFSDRTDLKEELNKLLNSFVILPESMDPYGIVKKTEHIIDLRESRFLNDIRRIVTRSDVKDSKIRNMSNMVEATSALNILYKYLEHYYLLAKKTGNFFLVAQLQMLVPLLFNEAKAYLYAVDAFRLGTPVGDSIGPFIVHQIVHDKKSKLIEVKKEYARDTDIYIAERENRKMYLVKASGPGGKVGKPGEAIKKLLEACKRRKEKIKFVIMIDAALKLEGEETGSIAEGVGAAIGGIGVEKFKIEEIVTKFKIPIVALVIKQSFNEAITTMKKEVSDAAAKVIKRIDKIISEDTEEEDSIIIAGIGNSIGVP